MGNMMVESFKVFGPIIGMLIVLTSFAFFIVRWLLKTSYERELRLSGIIDASQENHIKSTEALTKLNERIDNSVDDSKRASTYQREEHQKQIEQHNEILLKLQTLNGKK